MGFFDVLEHRRDLCCVHDIGGVKVAVDLLRDFPRIHFVTRVDDNFRALPSDVLSRASYQSDFIF